MTPTRQQLIDAAEHISFEMNRYLYTAYPKCQFSGHYREVVAESCLLHSRTIGEFFFEKVKYDSDVRITHYYDELKSKEELLGEVEKLKPNWSKYRDRLNQRLGHLTFRRNDNHRVHMQEKDALNFDVLIKLFEDNLPEEFREKWNRGKSFQHNELLVLAVT